MDSGYIRVRDQLWLWVYTVNKESKGEAGTTSAQLQAEAKVGEQVVGEPTSVEDQGQRPKEEDNVPGAGGHRRESAISSAGGVVFMGNVSAGRDFTYNHN